MPRKRVNPNQMEFDFLKGVEQKKKVRRFPEEKVKQRLIRLRLAKEARIKAEEYANCYKGMIADLQRKYGLPTKANARNYLQKLGMEARQYEAMARGFAPSGDKEMQEIHHQNAELVEKYANAIHKKFGIRK
jgi:hypothetical protein